MNLFQQSLYYGLRDPAAGLAHFYQVIQEAF
jgi:hypothetical protein